MKRERVIEIKKKTEVFGFGKLQDLVTLWNLLEERGVSFEELQEYLKLRRKEQRNTVSLGREAYEKTLKRWSERTRKCPNCKKPLMARGISTPKGKANREGYTCHWCCEEENCVFEEYTHEDFKEVYQKIMGGR